MIRVNEIFLDRQPGTNYRVTTWIVEGEKNNQPGMIRRVAFDKDGGNPWVRAEWEPGTDGAKNRLAGYDLRSDMRSAGAFFLQEAYEEIGKPEAYQHWLDFQAKCAPGDEFPSAWLPPRVLELQKLHKDKRRNASWVAPSGSLMGDDDKPDEMDDAPTVAGGTVTEKPKRGRRKEVA